MEIPILCNLTESELRERRQTILKGVRQSAIDALPIPLGYAYTFRPTSEVIMQLANMVDLERQCCQFLSFKIAVDPGGAPIRLEVTGPPDAAAIIEDFFGGAPEF